MFMRFLGGGIGHVDIKELVDEDGWMDDKSDIFEGDKDDEDVTFDQEQSDGNISDDDGTIDYSEDEVDPECGSDASGDDLGPEDGEAGDYSDSDPYDNL